MGDVPTKQPMERRDPQLEPRKAQDLIIDPVIGCLIGQASSDGHIFRDMGEALLDGETEVLTTPHQPPTFSDRVHRQVSADPPQPAIHRGRPSELSPVVPGSYPRLLHQVRDVVVAQHRTEDLKAASEDWRVGGVEPGQAPLVTHPEIIQIALRQQPYLLHGLTCYDASTTDARQDILDGRTLTGGELPDIEPNWQGRSSVR